MQPQLGILTIEPLTASLRAIAVSWHATDCFALGRCPEPFVRLVWPSLLAGRRWRFARCTNFANDALRLIYCASPTPLPLIVSHITSFIRSICVLSNSPLLAFGCTLAVVFARFSRFCICPQFLKFSNPFLIVDVWRWISWWSDIDYSTGGNSAVEAVDGMKVI